MRSRRIKLERRCRIRRGGKKRNKSKNAENENNIKETRLK
jgi:hypothetical protein